MPTATGLPRVGEAWTLTRKLPPNLSAGETEWTTTTTTVTIVERGRGDYWSLRVRHKDGRVALWVDASYYWSRGELRHAKS